jgi:hypothetical protein
MLSGAVEFKDGFHTIPDLLRDGRLLTGDTDVPLVLTA